MHITKDHVVTFHYRLTGDNQRVVEDSHDGSPMVYLHGHGGLIKGLEQALEGRRAGEQFTVTVPPELAYGPRQGNAVQRISKSHVAGASRTKTHFKPGMLVQVNTAHGLRTVVVAKVGLKTLDVDTNHPLAGRTLTFDIDVVDVRPGNEEEIAHGHAHGAGGHPH
jgi:FKBP-type peptidyl-prolyl cis-trans isomerase SlyD